MRIDDVELDLLSVAVQDPRIVGEHRLQPGDWHQPLHAAMWAAIVDIHTAGRTPDPYLIVEHGKSRGVTIPHTAVIDLIGRPAVPLNADRYADQIREAAVRRRIEAVVTRASQQLAQDVDTETIIQQLGALTAATTQDEELIESVMSLDEFVDQPLPAEQWVVPGLLTRGDRLVLTGTEGGGKALSVATLLPTPTGWTTMGEVAVGDMLIGADGKPVRVSFATDVMRDHECYLVEFSDGSHVIADGDHLWRTEDYTSRMKTAKARNRPNGTKPRGTDQRSKRTQWPEVVTTKQISETLHARGGHTLNHSIDATAPLDLPEAALPIDPYTLGAWLGDGTSLDATITLHPDDEQIINEIRSAGYTVDRKPDPYRWSITRREQRAAARAEAQELIDAGMSTRAAFRRVGIDRRKGAEREPIKSLREELRGVGVLGDKHIPDGYLRGSYAQRLALLQGLMDTDGTIGDGSGTGRGNGAAICEFCSTNQQLAYDTWELITSLGIISTIKASPAKLYGRMVGTRYRISFQTELPVFRLDRKLNRIAPLRTQRSRHRFITSVTQVESVPVKCVQVDNVDHMYLCGEAMIPTHNTTMLRQLGICVAAGVSPFTGDAITPQRVLFVDAENPVGTMVRKMRAIRDAIHATTDDRMWIKRYPQGLDLGGQRDRLALRELCATFRPDLLIIGPAYKLYVGGRSDREEDLARLVTSTLDGLREEFGFALAVEHHSPHHAQGVAKRSVRPIGSSLWLRWPEFGYGLSPDADNTPAHRSVEMIPWRGAREERDWPSNLVQGAVLPWINPYARKGHRP